MLCKITGYVPLREGKKACRRCGEVIHNYKHTLQTGLHFKGLNSGKQPVKGTQGAG